MKKSVVSFTSTFIGISGFPSNIGAYTKSPSVELDDRLWSIRIYPGGYDEDSKGFLSCFLSYESRGQARAAFKVSILNQKGWKNHTITSDNVKLFVNSVDTSESAVWGDAKFVSKADLRNQSNGFCVDDKLVIKVEMTVYGDIEQSILSTNAPCLGSPSKARSLAEEMCTLLGDEADADVTLQVGDVRIPAHKFILCLRSEVLRAMLTGGMRESQSLLVAVPDFEAAVVREFLHYLYTDSCSGPRVLEQHAEALLAMACKYQVRGLEALCENHLCSALCVANALETLSLADLYCAKHLKTRSLLFISHNARAVVQSEGFRRLSAELYPEVLMAVVGVDSSQHSGADINVAPDV